MRGQLWSEYLIIVAVFGLAGLLAFAIIYPPFKEVVACSAIHTAVLKEITKEEVNTLRDYSLFNVACDLEKREVNVYCHCEDKDAVKDLTLAVLEGMGEEDVNVEVYG